METTGIIIDSFAGGGGASTGIEWAIGRSPDIAINHDPLALAMHEANHPLTLHVCEDVYKANLRKLTGGRPVGLLWASPDCRHFSRAKGSKPVSKSVRSLAWMVVKWAEQIKPGVIILENVREFADWGPLVPQWVCRQCDWKGTEGQAVLMRVHRRCPRCESKRIKPTLELVPDPTRKGLTFRRFTGRLRNLGYAVEWKNLDAADYGAPTHRKRLFLIARRDGQPIDWPEPTHGDPKRLDDAPLFAPSLKPWRTAAECIDWSLPCPSIFDRKRPLAEKTLGRIAMGIKRYVLDSPAPFIVPITHRGDRRSYPLFEPLPTITTSNRGELALCAPILSKYHHERLGDRDGRCGRCDESFNTLDTQNRYAVVAAYLAKHFGGVVGVPIETPLPTTTTRATQNQVVAANLIYLNHGDKQWSGVDGPLRAITAAGKHAALVYSFLVKYFGTSIGANLWEPAPTVTVKDRFGLVVVTIDGELYAIVDIGMRMLTPRELALAQGFPPDYILTGTKSQQVARIGNSVCPPIAAAMVQANCGSCVLV